MNGLNRIKIDFNPEKNKHYVYGWNAFFYPNNPTKIYEDWECLFPIEDVEDWKDILFDIIERTINNDKEGAK